jgi:aminoglycoside phosphotransferase family enzyme
MAVPSPPDLRFADGCAEDVRETHISWVFLTAERAYKVKKPVVLPFLDYGTAARRRIMCRAEVALNRRLAPDVYVGVRWSCTRRAAPTSPGCSSGPIARPGARRAAMR